MNEKILEILEREMEAKWQEKKKYPPFSEMAHKCSHETSGMRILAKAIIEELEENK